MRKLLRCRRGSVAFATVIALIPLIGAIALGGEAASWYVTRQHAQNAADSAAVSGALRLACSSAGSCSDTESVSYRGKEFAAQNGYCNSGDTSYPGSLCTTPPTGVSQTVAIDIGTYSGGTWTTTQSGSYVRATVQQTQPGYLASLLGLSTIDIAAQAIAEVQQPFNPCVLALTGSISFQGSPNITSPTCGMASNDTANNALNFTGGGMSLDVGSLSASGGCSGSSTFCNKALTYQQPVINPFSALDGITLPTLSNCTGSSLTAYSATTPCENNNFTLTGNSSVALNGGVYFISGKLSIKGKGSITGTGLFILLPGATLSLTGSGGITLTANASLTKSQLPAVLQKYASDYSPSCTTTDTCLLNNLSIYDQSSSAFTMRGNSNITFNGNMYLPSAAVTFQGNPDVSACGQLIAASIAFNGNATFDNSGCKNNFGAPTPTTQVVALVQ